MTGEPDPVTLDVLATEAARPELADLDTWPTSDAVQRFFDDQDDVASALRSAAHQITAVVDVIAERMRAGGRLIYVGAGTGGRLAALDAAEVGPTYGVRGRVMAVFAGGVDAMTDGREFYEDDAAEGARQVRALRPAKADVVVGVSASGRTPFVLGGVSAAREAGAHTVGLVNVTGSRLAAVADSAIEVVSGPEIIAGSTRLKAGTAQKAVLNVLSTMAMVRLGRTYGNLMVDVVADNGKLRRRALRAVVQATDVSEERAAAVLDEAGGQAKVAIVALLGGITAARASALLEQASGRIRDAIGLASGPD